MQLHIGEHHTRKDRSAIGKQETSLPRVIRTSDNSWKGNVYGRIDSISDTARQCLNTSNGLQAYEPQWKGRRWRPFCAARRMWHSMYRNVVWHFESASALSTKSTRTQCDVIWHRTPIQYHHTLLCDSVAVTTSLPRPMFPSTSEYALNSLNIANIQFLEKRKV